MRNLNQSCCYDNCYDAAFWAGDNHLTFEGGRDDLKKRNVLLAYMYLKQIHAHDQCWKKNILSCLHHAGHWNTPVIFYFFFLRKCMLKSNVWMWEFQVKLLIKFYWNFFWQHCQCIIILIRLAFFFSSCSFSKLYFLVTVLKPTDGYRNWINEVTFFIIIISWRNGLLHRTELVITNQTIVPACAKYLPLMHSDKSWSIGLDDEDQKKQMMRITWKVTVTCPVEWELVVTIE